MSIVKALHVIFAFIWIGNLLTLTRLMGYHVKEDEHTQMRLARIYKRMYRFVELPSMVITVILGTVLLTHIDLEKDLTYLLFKISFAIGLIICDLITGQFVGELNQHPDSSKGIKYKILHGITGLLLIGLLCSIYILKN